MPMSSPDRIPPGETKPERERRVFRFFAADAAIYAAFNILTETVSSREPPEPDILCEVIGEGPVAFELAEILDQASMKVMATMMSARHALHSSLSELCASDLDCLRSKFATKQVKVAFRQDKPLRELAAIIPSLYHWLIHGPYDDLYGYSVPLPADLGAVLEYVSILSGPLDIDIAFGVNVVDATISSATSKLVRKLYTTTAPIELLVYAHDQPLIQYEAWRSTIAAAIVPLIDESIVRGHFRRVWIYDISLRKTDQSIKFIYPTWRP